MIALIFPILADSGVVTATANDRADNRTAIMLDKATSPDIDTAIAFLKALRPRGPWNLTALVPDGPVYSETFTDLKKARAWLTKHAGSANLHYTANPAASPTGKGGRVRKEDIGAIAFLHGDYDVDKLPADHELASLSITERKRAVAGQMQSFDEPTVIVNSGGGIQAVWRLKEPLAPTEENVAWAEGANRWLAMQFAGGEPQCANIDHLLRLPGTVNYPNAHKRERGRTVAAARLVAQSDLSYDRAAFKSVPRSASKRLNIEFGRPEEVTDLDALATEYGLSVKLTDIILHGHDPDNPERLPSRSEWVFSVVNQLLRHRVPPEPIMGVLLNPEWGISDSVLEQDDKPGGRTSEDYAAYQVRRAMEKQDAERRADEKMLVDDAVSPDELEGYEGNANARPASSSTDWQVWYRDNFVAIGHRDIAAIPCTPWLTEGLLLYGDVTTIGGRGGSGKSLLAWQIVVAVATGRALAWWPAPERPRKVIVISGEDDVDEIERRVSAACQALGLARSELGDNFMVWNHRSIRLASKDGKSGSVSLTTLHHGLRWAVENLDVGLIVLDPLIKSSSGFEESRNDHMEEVYSIVRDLIVGHRCAALTVDHFAKAGTGGDQASIRGASAKVDAARVAITLTGMTEAEFERLRPPRPRESYALCVDAKQNYAKKSPGHWLELIDYEVGNGETRPSLIWRSLDSTDEFLDPQRWRHRAAFLRLVSDGRIEGDQGGQPWSASGTGPRNARLAVAVSQAFDLTEKQAVAWIRAFADEGSISIVDWVRPNRTVTKVWAINPGYQTEEDAETEAIRE